jgi:predicted KAP-like P-loop ATPase
MPLGIHIRPEISNSIPIMIIPFNPWVYSISFGYQEKYVLHTFSYSYNDDRILTVIAQSKQVLDINYNDWVNGIDINHHILQGFYRR